MSNRMKIKDKTKKTKKEKQEELDTTTKLVREALKQTNMKLDKKQEELLVQIFKFVVVGGIATIIDWIIYFVLYNFVKVQPIYANIISFSVSVIYNYWASCKYVFKVNKNKSKKRQFIEFIIFAVIGLGINEAIIFAFVNKLAWNAMLVKIFATAIVMVFNFITRKKFLE